MTVDFTDVEPGDVADLDEDRPVCPRCGAPYDDECALLLCEPSRGWYSELAWMT